MRMQGAGRHAHSERGLDLYETPAICVMAALKAGVLDGLAGPLWEPSAGRSAMSRELRKAGFDVIAQDLAHYPGKDEDMVAGIDFLLERAAPHGVQVIVTNPPFRATDKIIRHALSLVPRVIVLLRAMSIEGERRSDLIDAHLRHYWIGIDRPPALHRDGWAGPRLHNSGAPFAWFDFSAAPRPPSQPIALRRFWWAEAKRDRVPDPNAGSGVVWHVCPAWRSANDFTLPCAAEGCDRESGIGRTHADGVNRFTCGAHQGGEP